MLPISRENIKNIPCVIEQELEEKNYILDSYIGSSGNGIFYIIQEKEEFQLSCSEGKSNFNIIIGVVVSAVVIIVGIIILAVCCKKKEKTKNEITEVNSGRNMDIKTITFSKNINDNNNFSSLRNINKKNNNGNN